MAAGEASRDARLEVGEHGVGHRCPGIITRS